PALDALRDWLRRRAPNVPVAETEHRPTEFVGCDGATEPLELFRGRTVGAFCGIGNPRAFRLTLESLGATVADFRTFPDHHGYTRADVEALTRWAEALPAGAPIATTQKDFVKLRVPALGGRPLWAVRIGLHFRDGEPAFTGLLERVLAGPAGPLNNG
ncbi:MAG TPA: tetraacyldisaccharide 4'-kinase, partial [Gemmata sp.]